MVNIIKNPSFSSGKIYWELNTNGTGTFNVVSGVAEIKFTVDGTVKQLYQADIPLQPNSTYILKFDASSSLGHDLEVNLIKHVSPFISYGLDYIAPLTTTMETFTKTFTTTNFTSSVTDGRLRFWFSRAVVNEIFKIDNIILELISTPCVNLVCKIYIGE